MKYSETLLPVLSKVEITKLTQQTIEKPDIHLPAQKSKKFTGIDFWNIQKQRRNISSRRLILTF